MKFFNNNSAPVLLVSAITLLIACGKLISPDPPDEKVLVNNDVTLLNSHLQAGAAKSLPLSQAGENAADFDFLLHATVAPLQYGDKILHAVHVTLNGDFAYVAYATPENEYFGGIEIINIKDVSRPKILSQMIFTEADITIVLRAGNRIFIGGAADSDKIDNISSPAVFGIIELHAGLLSGDYKIFDLPSFNANDIVIVEQTALVTSGTTGGGLTIFDLNTRQHAFTPISGAKALEVTTDGIYIMEGTGVNLHVYSPVDTSFIETIPLGCANMYQSKAETEVQDNVLFFSSGSCGMRAIDLLTREMKYAYKIPNGGHCNGVSVNDDLVFLANDTSGLAVLQIEEDGLAELGFLRFDAPVNYVISHDNKLFVAAAKAGLKIIEIQTMQ